jgi:DNA-binding NtrC family response regulator
MNAALRIIVADRESDMRRFMYQTLTHEGHRVIATAENGRQLVDECINQPPDLIITDIEMPELDGLAALHEICMTNPVPAIIVSANSDQEMLVRASRELVFAYLVKPIKMDDLQPAIWLTMQRYSEVAVLRQRLIGLD